MARICLSGPVWRVARLTTIAPSPADITVAPMSVPHDALSPFARSADEIAPM